MTSTFTGFPDARLVKLHDENIFFTHHFHSCAVDTTAFSMEFRASLKFLTLSGFQFYYSVTSVKVSRNSRNVLYKSVLLTYYPRRLCRSAWVECSTPSVCLFVCLSVAQGELVPETSDTLTPAIITILHSTSNQSSPFTTNQRIFFP